jgi:DNA-directed RNA polymerase specialized sigma24 family protein
LGVEYLNNKVFEELIARYKKTKKNVKRNKPAFTAVELELTAVFYLLAKNIIKAFKFQLVDKDDALQEGVMICFEKLDRFDPNRGKAFNYCSTILLNLYKQMYRTAKNYNELKVKYHEYLYDKVDDVHLNGTRAKGKNKYKKFLPPNE